MAVDPTRPPSDDEARARFMMIGFMRIAGIVMVLLGILVARQVIGLPQWTAWVLIVLGLIETFVTPRILARMWSTNDFDPPES